MDERQLPVHLDNEFEDISDEIRAAYNSHLEVSNGLGRRGKGNMNS